MIKNCIFFRGKAPIASMDAMEDMDLLSGSNTHLSKLSSDGNVAGHLAAGSARVAVEKPVSAVPGDTKFPGIKYRNIGKTGLKVSNLGLGK